MGNRVFSARTRIVCASILASALIVARRPSSILHAQPFAEDGTVFIEEQIHHGLWAVFLRYAGYYHLVPRLVAALGVHASMAAGAGISLAPLVMNACAVLTAGACATVLLWARFDWLGPVWVRALMALAVVMLPISAEVFGNITNIQWWLGFVQVLSTWDMLRTRRAPSVPLLVLLVLASFSGPLGIIPALAAAWLLAGRPAAPSALRLAVLLPGPAVEMASVLTSPRSAVGAHPLTMMARYLPRAVLTGVVSGQVLPNLPGTVNAVSFGTVSLLGATILVAVALCHGGRWRELGIPAAIFLGVSILTAAGARYWPGSYYYPYHLTAGRYVFVPMALLAVCILRSLWVALRGGVAPIVAAALLVALMIATDAAHARLAPLQQYGWARAVAAFDPSGAAICNVHIPPGLVMSLPCRG